MLVSSSNYQTSKSQPSSLSDYTKVDVKIGNKPYTLFIADTQEKRVKGLSNNEDLTNNQGMLFAFDTKEYHSFWMKDMKYPLDFICLDENEVIDIRQNISPDTYPNIITPKFPANKVVEIHAGEVVKSGLNIGDYIDIE